MPSEAAVFIRSDVATTALWISVAYGSLSIKRRGPSYEAFIFIFLMALAPTLAMADLPAPPDGAELGACQPQQQKLATDTECVRCDMMGSGDPCEKEWKPKGYEKRCDVEVRGYNNEVWCKGTVSAKKPEAKAEAKSGACSIDAGNASSAAALFGLFFMAVLAVRQKRSKG